ncbi:MAG: TIR domain-containing protein [Pseudomonadota bacterium]
MSDLFISYARGDHERARRLAVAMEDAGYSVWWDRELLSGDDFSAQIEQALNAADAVIVCWSVEAAQSRWVRDEASVAADSGKLISVSLDASEPPMGFRQFHCDDLSGWRSEADHAALARVLQAVRGRLQRDAPAPTTVSGASTPVSRQRTWWWAAGVAALVATGWVALRGNEDSKPATINARPPDSSEVRRYGILLPEEAPVTFIGSSPLRTPLRALSITPDGQRLIYTGPSATDTSQLFVRDLGDFEVQAIPGTGGAYEPFVSPDGNRVAFFAEDELRIAPLDGGAVRTVLATPNPQGGAWWGNDRIIYSDREGEFTWWVTINSGATPEPLQLAEPAMPDGSPIRLSTYLRPMPGGETVLTVAYPGFESYGRLTALDPAQGTLETIIDLAVTGWARNGALVYVIGNELFAVDFDNASNQVTSEPRLVGDELRRDATVPQFVASDQTLIYATGGPYLELQIARARLDGGIDETSIDNARFGSLAVSPDGQQLAASIYGNRTDIHLYDLASGASRRLTRGGDNNNPFWSADGQVLYFSHENGEQPAGIYKTEASSASFQKLLVYESRPHLNQVTADNLGALIVATETGPDYGLVDLETGELTMVAEQPGVTEDLGHVSPDGRWLALTVDASGRYEVVVMPLFNEGPTLPVSTTGGEEPSWSEDMSSLFYRYGTRLFRVPIGQVEDSLAFGEAEVVLDDPMWVNVGGYSYWADEQNTGFFILRDNQPPTARELRVVEGWRSIR